MSSASLDLDGHPDDSLLPRYTVAASSIKYELNSDDGLSKATLMTRVYPVCEMERNAAHVDRGALQEAVTASASLLQNMLLDIPDV